MTAVLLVGFRARRSRLEQIAEGDARARLALREISEISEYLSACQLGVTFASIRIGFSVSRPSRI